MKIYWVLVVDFKNINYMVKMSCYLKLINYNKLKHADFIPHQYI